MNKYFIFIIVELVHLQGGWFMMGTDDPGIPQDGEGPQRRVCVDPFNIEEHEVTNQQFQHFINRTGYITEVNHNHLQDHKTNDTHNELIDLCL